MRKTVACWALVILLLLAVVVPQFSTVDAANDPGGGGCGVTLMNACAKVKGYPFQCTPRYQKLGSSAYCYGCVPINYMGTICGGTSVYIQAMYYNSCLDWMWYYAAGFGWIGADWVHFQSCST